MYFWQNVIKLDCIMHLYPCSCLAKFSNVTTSIILTTKIYFSCNVRTQYINKIFLNVPIMITRKKGRWIKGVKSPTNHIHHPPPREECLSHIELSWVLKRFLLIYRESFFSSNATIWSNFNLNFSIRFQNYINSHHIHWLLSTLKRYHNWHINDMLS